ncbi:MAG: DUF308 domain-containing protein [Clostridia bacterium]
MESKKRNLSGAQEALHKIAKKKKTLGIILSVIIILMGIFCLCKPLNAIAITEWIFSLGFIIAGICRIVQYVAAPKPYRTPMILISGILWIIVGILFIVGTKLDRTQIFAFLIGFMAMSDGITRLCATGVVKEAGLPVGWNVFSGILSILLSIFVFIAPLYMTTLLAFIAGAYLVVYGIITLIDMISVKIA